MKLKYCNQEMFFKDDRPGAGRIYQMPYKHEDWSLDPQNLHKEPVIPVGTSNPGTGRQTQEDLWGFLASQIN